MNTMVIKINGVPIKNSLIDTNICLLEEVSPVDFRTWVKENYSRKDIPKLKKLSVFLWTVAGSILATAPAFAQGSGDTSSLWTEMMPIFRVFQDIAMVLGAICIFTGLIIMMFKKQAGKKFLMTSFMVVGGCFIVPAAIMLVAIIGGMLNETLINVFENSGLKNSVNVNGN